MKAASVRRLVQLLTTFGPCMAGVLIALVLVSLSPPHVGGAPKFSEWGTPENLGCVVNSAFSENFPTMSKSGLSLYFASNRGSAGGPLSEIWVSQRSSVDDPWGPPVNLGPIINTADVAGGPSLSRDEHWLFFNRIVEGQRTDIWASWREDVHDDLGWQAPQEVKGGVNSESQEAGTSYFENEEGGVPLLFFGRGSPAALTSDIYVSELQPDGSFGEAMKVEELSSSAADQRPSVSHDGLELFLTRNDSSNQPRNFEVMVSTRETVFDAWGTPTKLSTINNAVCTDDETDPTGTLVPGRCDDGQAHIAADRRTLFFASGRPKSRTCGPEETGDCACGPEGTGDLYMTTRTKKEK